MLHRAKLALAATALVAATVLGVRAQPTTCQSANGLPDPHCTPGVVAIADPSVLCAPGYSTAAIRPPTSYTNALKAQQIVAYGYTDTDPADFEEDHLVPLELGGHPRAPGNLWPEPYSGAYGAHEKDRVENETKRRVCAGQMALADAQQSIAQNWIALGQQEGVVK